MTLQEILEAVGAMHVAAEAHGLQDEVVASLIAYLAPDIKPVLLEVAIEAALGEWDI